MGNEFSDTELKVMNIVWDAGGEASARDIYDGVAETEGWTRGTVYTLIKRCMAKGGLERTDPGFVCRALVSRDSIRESETKGLLDKLFDGKVDRLFATLVKSEQVSSDEIEELRKMVQDQEDENARRGKKSKD